MTSWSKRRYVNPRSLWNSWYWTQAEIDTCQRLWISKPHFIFSDHHIVIFIHWSLFSLFLSLTLTLVRRAASPSRKVSFTQKPVVYPPTFGYSAPPLSSFLFPRFYSSSRYPHHPPNPVHHPSTIISSPDSSSLLKAFHPSNNPPLSSNTLLFLV